MLPFPGILKQFSVGIREDQLHNLQGPLQKDNVESLIHKERKKNNVMKGIKM